MVERAMGEASEYTDDTASVLMDTAVKGIASPSPPAYAETLPQDCPPTDAAPSHKRIVLRLVPSDPPSANDFRSHAAEGKVCPKRLDPCRWAACSVYEESVRPERIAGLAKLPNLRHMKFVAHIEIDEAAGVTKPWPDDTDHVSLWPYASFEAHNAVKKLVALE